MAQILTLLVALVLIVIIGEVMCAGEISRQHNRGGTQPCIDAERGRNIVPPPRTKKEGEI